MAKVTPLFLYISRLKPPYKKRGKETMRFIKNHTTGKHLWAKPMKLPRTLRGQLTFLNDLHRKMPEGIDRNQVATWLQECMEKNERSKKQGTRPSWRNLWLMDTPVYLWFMRRKAWFGICLDCDRGHGAKPLRRKEMYSMMAARKPGKWMTAPGTCLECAEVPA